MRVIFDPKANKEVEKLYDSSRSRVQKCIDLFEKFGFGLDKKYLKKISKNIWELRSGKIRVFITRVRNRIVIIHVMQKKSQRITKKTFTLLNSRQQEFL